MSLQVEQLSFAYGRMRVLQDVSATAGRGQITALIGPNASGKSTLLKCMMGYLRPQTGRVLVQNQNVHQMTARELAARVAYVPQRSIVSAAFTVQQVVELGRYALLPHPRKVEQAMNALELLPIADRQYRTLSVGQQQRVTLARALAQLSADGCLLLDEPTSAMDLRHVSLVMRLLREAADAGASVMLAMHDVALAARVADAAWLLNEGRIVISGTASQVMQMDQLQRVFEVPFEMVSANDDPPHLLPKLWLK